LLAVSLTPSLFLFSKIGNTITKTRVIVPSEYNEILHDLSKVDTLVIVEPAQQLYFKAYSWGYYGTDFIAYITPAQVITNATNNTSILNKYSLANKEINENNCPSKAFLLYDKNFVKNNDFQTTKLGVVIKQTDNLTLTRCE
jgi:hypothetical protein